MAYEAQSTLETATPDEVEPTRNILDSSALRRLTQRSDRRGALQFAAHLACMLATALLVSLTAPYWFLLIPAMALHGVTIVTMFAPLHECVHRTAFASRSANEIVGWAQPSKPTDFRLRSRCRLRDRNPPLSRGVDRARVSVASRPWPPSPARGVLSRIR